MRMLRQMLDRRGNRELNAKKKEAAKEAAEVERKKRAAEVGGVLFQVL